MLIYELILKTEKVRSRFENLIIPEPNTGCWLWNCCGPYGYGQFTIKPGNSTRAHRASWSLYRGEIPEGAFVLHKCDIRCCVNPDHLFLGTHTENMDDMVSKHRQAAGEKHGCAKLTSSQVLEIRSRYKRGNGVALAKEFGVSSSTVHLLVKGKTWLLDFASI